MLKNTYSFYFGIIIMGIVVIAYFYFISTKKSKIDGVEVLTIVADEFHDGEYFDTVKILIRKGAVITSASYTTETVTGYFGGTVDPEVTFDEVNVSQYDVIFIPGGYSPENIMNHLKNQTVYDILIQANDEGKIIAAMCHGPWLLAKANIVFHARVTCAVDQPMIDDLLTAGAILENNKRVISDGNIITGDGPDSVNEFSEEIIKALIEKFNI